MESIKIVGPKPRPDVVTRIAVDRERIEERSRRWTPPIETRAAASRCGDCGWCADAGHSSFCAVDQSRIEERAASRCGDCGRYDGGHSWLCQMGNGAEHRATGASAGVVRAGRVVEYGPVSPILGIR